MTASVFIYGFHAVTVKLRQHSQSVQEIYLDSGRQDQRAKELLHLANSLNVRVVLLDTQRLDGMAGGGKHQGVVAKAAPTQLANHLDDVLAGLTEPALLLVLDGVQDPHNLGACLRVADAFGVHAVIAPKDRAVGLNATAAKVACGAAETVPYLTVTNLARTLRELKEQDVWIVGTAADADQDLFAAKLEGALAWVLGAEGSGMRRLTRELCDFTVNIPMFGGVESLNVSVASGICIYEARRQRAMQTLKQ